MSRRTIYFHHSFSVFVALLIVLIIVVGLIFVGAIGLAFKDVGFSPMTITLILVATFLGSFVNIPMFKLKASVPIIKEEFVNFLGLIYRIPQVEYGQMVTVVAVNVGGALIPTTVSVYLLWRVPSAVLYCLVGVAVVAMVTRVIARPVKGVGIVTPAFIPPIVAAVLAYVLPSGAPRIVAYVAGVLGTLVGADLSNLNVIPKLGAPVASIGGAGTFDGVFLSGIIAVLLV